MTNQQARSCAPTLGWCGGCGDWGLLRHEPHSARFSLCLCVDPTTSVVTGFTQPAALLSASYSPSARGSHWCSSYSQWATSAAGKAASRLGLLSPDTVLSPGGWGSCDTNMATSEEAMERGRHAEAGLDRTQPRGDTIYFVHTSVSPSDWRVQFPLVGSPQPQDPTHRLQAGCHLLPFPRWQAFPLIAALPPHPPFCSLSSESDSESAARSREPSPSNPSWQKRTGQVRPFSGAAWGAGVAV